MALIAMAAWNTVVNNRKWMLEKTLETLRDTVQHDRHRVVVVDNGSEPETGTAVVYEKFKQQFPFTLIQNETNRGTARAINQAWLLRQPEEHAVKMDSDLVIHDKGWADRLEEAVERDHTIGICGLKRKDCIEAPWVEGWYKSSLEMLPHKSGETWIVAEFANHVMGTTQLYSHRLLAKIGFLWQASLCYAFDDSFAAARCKHAGFRSCFLPQINLDHIDPGDTEYQKDKERIAASFFPQYHQILREFANGTRSIYFGPNDD